MCKYYKNIHRTYREILKRCFADTAQPVPTDGCCENTKKRPLRQPSVATSRFQGRLIADTASRVPTERYIYLAVNEFQFPEDFPGAGSAHR